MKAQRFILPCRTQTQGHRAFVAALAGKGILIYMQSRQKKILVVDDEPDILEFLRELLELEGYIVATSDKGEYVQQIHDRSFPDLILLDVLLSGKDGREIVKHLKSQEKTKHIPVIMFSAHPSAEPTARAAGADDFLAKPFEMDELLTKIANYF
ncbi:MAG TPA: response regulator [Ktedonobacteraceae bacterium]|nr:response regulator [Ktedonobacteraceae bacterium]